MESLFRRRNVHAEIPRQRTRVARGGDGNVNRVALGELTPDLPSYLGRAAYLQLSIFQTASVGVSGAPNLRGSHAMTGVAQRALASYAGLVDEIARAGHDPVATMEPFRSEIDDYRRKTEGADWYENLVTSYVTAGLLDEFLIRLADGLSEERSTRIAALLSTGTTEARIADELLTAISENALLPSRLALWGRRLVGDTLLLARGALAVPENTAPDEARLEPIFTELITNHARRMDALGLTA